MSKINESLQNMHSQQGVDKGSYGEDAVFYAMEELFLKTGGLLYHSLTIPVDPNLPGNIKKIDGILTAVGLSPTGTEVDVVYITQNRIFLLEVKAYRSNKIILTTDGIAGVYVTDKSPLHQNEMHARHFYSIFREAVPFGDSNYIVPITVFVDKCEIDEEQREPEDKALNKIARLNNIKKTVVVNNTQLYSDVIIDLACMERLIEDKAKYKKNLTRVV